MKLIAYLRVSSRGQVDGDGPERQTAACQAFCARHNIELVATELEPGVSGDDVDRPVLGAVIARIQESQELDPPVPKIDGIIVERMDRFSRDLLTGELLLQQCRESGVAVYSADSGTLDNLAEGKSTTDPTRVLIRQVLMAVAQFAKSELLKKMQSARTRKAALTGRPCGSGWALFGLHSKEEFEEVKFVHILLDRGYSATDVARYMRALQFKLRDGWEWTAQRVVTVQEGRASLTRIFPDGVWKDEITGQALVAAKATQRYQTLAQLKAGDRTRA